MVEVSEKTLLYISHLLPTKVGCDVGSMTVVSGRGLGGRLALGANWVCCEGAVSGRTNTNSGEAQSDDRQIMGFLLFAKPNMSR
jgi:hypothetical protein